MLRNARRSVPFRSVPLRSSRLGNKRTRAGPRRAAQDRDPQQCLCSQLHLNFPPFAGTFHLIKMTVFQLKYLQRFEIARDRPNAARTPTLCARVHGCTFLKQGNLSYVSGVLLSSVVFFSLSLRFFLFFYREIYRRSYSIVHFIQLPTLIEIFRSEQLTEITCNYD